MRIRIVSNNIHPIVDFPYLKDIPSSSQNIFAATGCAIGYDVEKDPSTNVTNFYRHISFQMLYQKYSAEVRYAILIHACLVCYKGSERAHRSRFITGNTTQGLRPRIVEESASYIGGSSEGLL